MNREEIIRRAALCWERAGNPLRAAELWATRCAAGGPVHRGGAGDHHIVAELLSQEGDAGLLLWRRLAPWNRSLRWRRPKMVRPEPGQQVHEVLGQVGRALTAQ